MYRLVLVCLIIFLTSVRSKTYPDIITSGLDNENRTFLVRTGDADFSPDIEINLKKSQEGNSTYFGGGSSFDSSSHNLGGKEELAVNGAGNQNEGSGNFNSSKNSASVKRMTTEKEVLDYLTSIHEVGSGNYQEISNEEPELIPSLIRREVSNWPGFHEFIEADNVPWSLESYDGHVGGSLQQNSFERGSYQEYIDRVKNDSSLNAYQKPGEVQYGVEFPQYVQKNYYNNFYVVVPNKKQAAAWNAEELTGIDRDGKPRGNGRKTVRKNECKQYLQLLKYAFQKLDDDSYYYYDDNEQFETGMGDQQAVGKTQPAFQTHLLGPTLYVDNSGKIAKSNIHGTKYQGNERGEPKYTTHYHNNFKFGTTVVTDYDMTTTSENSKDFEHTTTDNFWANPTESEPTTELNSVGPHHEEEENLRYPAYFPDIMKNFRSGGFKTTLPPITEKSTTYSSRDSHTTLYSPKGRISEQSLGKSEGMGKTDDPSMINIFTGMTDSPYHSFPYWFTLLDIQSTRPTSSPQTTSWVPRTESDNSYLDVPTELPKNNEDADCNDKMLPCPDTVNVTYPLNGYCNRYVTCESGRAIRRVCSNGLHYNPITKSCDLPHNSICTYVCPEANGVYGLPGDCGGYFICKNSIPEYRMCPPKMHWDVRRESCTFEELSSCPMKCVEENKIQSYEGDCKAYVICLHGIPYYHRCPPNTKFDHVSQTCIPERLSTCENDPRLLVKTVNPNILCNSILKKFGTRSWCNSFSANKNTVAPYIK